MGSTEGLVATSPLHDVDWLGSKVGQLFLHPPISALIAVLVQAVLCFGFQDFDNHQ
jgi:hypothetical protein